MNTEPTDAPAGSPDDITALYQALVARLAAGYSHEDPPVPAQALDQAEAAFARASSDPARAIIAVLGTAMIDTLRPALPAFRRAEQIVRGLLQQPPGTLDAERELEARLLLLDILGRVVDAEPADGREAFLRRAVAHARTTQYLATLMNVAHGRARALAWEATWLTECFDCDRDQCLMDAVEVGTRALALLPTETQAREIRWPLLLLHLGNACVKIAPDRELWLKRGIVYYRQGRALTNTTRHPGLARALDGNAAVQGALSEQDKLSLPPKETYPRYRRRAELAASAGDLDAALAVAYEAVEWAQRLGEQPNVYVGHTHVLFGQILFSARRWDQAAAEFERAITVLEQLFRPDERDYGYVRSAQGFLEQARARAAEARVDAPAAP